MGDELWSKYIDRSEEELLNIGDSACDVEQLHLSDVPQIASKQDVTAFLDVIAQSHGCNAKDISYYCEPIIDDDGNVKITEVWLIFNIKSLINGEIINRQVYSMRIATSQEVQQRAYAMQRKSEQLITQENSMQPEFAPEVQIEEPPTAPTLPPPSLSKTKRIPRTRTKRTPVKKDSHTTPL
jgi:hypothetical protein